jgi:CHAT domain-containing protein/tetratricopeptide (TPR) repeat protein
LRPPVAHAILHARMPRRDPLARGPAASAVHVAALVAAFKTEAWDEARRLLEAQPSLLDPEIAAEVGRATAEKPPRKPVPRSPSTPSVVKRKTRSRIRVTSTPDLLSDSERDFNAFMDSMAVDRAEEEYRLLFARCAEVGIDAAFWEAGKVTAPAEVKRLRDEAERTHLFDDDILELDEDQTPRALGDWRSIVAHADFSRAPLPLQQQILGELADLLSNQLTFTDDAEVAEERVRVCERLVALNDTGSESLASDLEGLGNAWIVLFKRTGRLDALDKAVNVFGEAVDASRSPDSPAVLWSLGSALSMRYEFSTKAADLDGAIAALEAGKSAAPHVNPSNLAIALMLRSRRSRNRRDLNRAIDLLGEHARHKPDAGTLNNLATAFLQRHERTRSASDLQQAINALRKALAKESRPADRPGQLANLLRALRKAPQTRRVTSEARLTIAEIRALAADVNPEGAVAAFQAWGEWAAARGEWSEAAIAFDSSARGVDTLLTRQASREQKEHWLRRADGAAIDAAYALAKQGELVEAVLAFERGRAFLLREDLLRADSGRGAAVASFGDLQRAAAESPLVLIAAREWGGFALLVRADAPVQVIWLPRLTSAALAQRVHRYLAAYSRRAASAKAWDATITETTRWLWQVAMGRVAHAVADRPAVAVAAGSLGLLPLHAAWAPDSEARDRKRYVLDTMTLTYAPSIASLLFARLQASAAAAGGIAAVADPHTRGRPRLPAANGEVRVASRYFPRATVLKQRHATRDRVIDALRQHGVWHFACHGFAAHDMAESGVVLANDDVLTIGQLADLDDIGTHVRVAVFSACETAVVDGSLPDEAVSLPTAMMRAGAAATIGSLWSVAAGASTAVLFGRFYQLWRENGLDPADALRDAQRWTRDATNGEKHSKFPRLVVPPRGLAARDRDAWARIRAHREPYFWAPFVFVGA